MSAPSSPRVAPAPGSTSPLLGASRRGINSQRNYDNVPGQPSNKPPQAQMNRTVSPHRDRSVDPGAPNNASEGS